MMLRFLIPLQKNDRIPYFNDLPSKKGTSLQYITSEQFTELFKTTFAEGLSINPNMQSALQWDNNLLNKDGILSGIDRRDLESRINNIINGQSNEYLAITKMDNAVGHGVFAIKDIPKHTVLCIYSGEIEIGTQTTIDHSNEYLFYSGNFRISANRVRGVASFMQHLPGNTEAFGENHHLYARTNVMTEFVIINNIPVIAVVALRNISANEQVGFTYGDYWKTRGHPHLFYHSGEIAPRKEYTIRHLLNSYQYIPHKTNNTQKIMSIMDDKSLSYYDILELKDTATADEIKKAYKNAALKYHPDKASVNDLTDEQANAVFKKVSEAYETLGDTNRKNAYDAMIKRNKTYTPLNSFAPQKEIKTRQDVHIAFEMQLPDESYVVVAKEGVFVFDNQNKLIKKLLENIIRREKKYKCMTLLSNEHLAIISPYTTYDYFVDIFDLKENALIFTIENIVIDPKNNKYYSNIADPILLALSDGKLAVANKYDQFVHIYNSLDGQLVDTINLNPNHNHYYRIASLACMAESILIIAETNSYYGRIHLYDMKQKNYINSFDCNPSISFDGCYVEAKMMGLTSSGNLAILLKDTVDIYQPLTNQKVGSFSVKGINITCHLHLRKLCDEFETIGNSNQIKLYN